MRNNYKLKEYFKKPSWFKYLFKRFLKFFEPLPPVFTEPGTHIITGYPGSGKTLLMNHIKNETDLKKNFYLSNLPEFKNVKSFDINEIFQENKQVKRFPIKQGNKRIFGVIFDEINLEFNKRLNHNKEYNNIFVGLMEFCVSHRHQKIDRLFFIGQKIELQDNQLYSIFKYQHNIRKTKRHYKFFLYHEKLILKKVPTKLVVDSFIKMDDNTFIKYKTNRIKLKRIDLETYNTHALYNNYKNLPLVELKK